MKRILCVLLIFIVACTGDEQVSEINENQIAADEFISQIFPEPASSDCPNCESFEYHINRDKLSSYAVVYAADGAVQVARIAQGKPG